MGGSITRRKKITDTKNPPSQTNIPNSSQIHVHHLKVACVGNIDVGKTSFLQRLSNPNQPFPTGPIPDFSSLTTTLEVLLPNNPEPQKFELWLQDTWRQERFYSIGGSWYRGIKIALVCFDPYDEYSWTFVPKWNLELERYVPDSVKALVAMKCDLPTINPPFILWILKNFSLKTTKGSPVLPLDLALLITTWCLKFSPQRRVAAGVVREYAEQLDLLYFETSAKDMINITQPFVELIKLGVERIGEDFYM